MNANRPIEPCRIEEGNGWKKLKTETTYQDPYIEIQRVHYQTPSRKDVPWTVALRKSGVVIAARNLEGEFLLIQQERLPIQRTLWEFPAGQIDSLERPLPSTLILETAVRELEEETGHTVTEETRIIPMGYFFSSHGFTDEHCYQFFFDGVIPNQSGIQEDSGECILACKGHSLETIQQLIAENTIQDANTLVSFAKMQALGLI